MGYYHEYGGHARGPRDARLPVKSQKSDERMGTELRQQYDLLVEGAQEGTGSDPVDDVVGDLQPLKECALKPLHKA